MISPETDTHSIATLQIPAAGSYIATSKVTVRSEGGSGIAHSLCDLTATTTNAEGPSTDQSDGSLWSGGSAYISVTTQSDQVTHVFSGPGTITLECQENGLNSGGADLEWQNASIIAIRVSSVTTKAVTQ